MDCLATEQDFSKEVDEMLACWKTGNENAIPKDIIEDATKRDHYDGETSASDLKKGMIQIADTNIYLRKVRVRPEGKEITSANTVLYDVVSFIVGCSKPFENSISIGKPSRVSLEKGPIVTGLLYAMLNLREGEQSYVLVHPSLGFGKLGCPPMIPPDAYLYYYIKIHRVFEESTLSKAIEYERDNLIELPIEEKVNMIEEHKKIANAFWKDNQVREALMSYKDAIEVIEEFDQKTIMSTEHLRVKMVELLLNATISLNKLGNYKSATKYAKKALKFDPDNVKIYYHLAKARIGLADYLTALCWIERARKLEPNNRSFYHLKLQLEPHFRNYDEDELLKRMASCTV